MNGNLHVLQHSHLSKGPDNLVSAGDPRFDQLEWFQTRDIAPKAADSSGTRLQRPGNHAEKSGFSGAVRPNEPENLSLADLEAHVLDGGQASEVLGNFFNFQDG